MIPQEQAHLNAAAATDKGMSGKNNEDRYGISAHALSTNAAVPAVFAIVADGIGGHQAGEVAAEIAVESISAAVAESDGENPPAILRDAVVGASQQIRSQADGNSAMRGMGSTCACAWIIEDQLYTATVGDSRIYLIRSGTITQISIDHTWIQEAITYGIIKPEQAKGHPQAHVIRQYLGSEKPPEVDFRIRLHADDTDQQALRRQGLKLSPGDRLVLCSDGLTDLVSDEEIRDTLEKFGSDAGVNHLVDLANHNGGHDNITIITLQYPDKNQTSKTKQKSRRSFYTLAGIGLAAAAIILLGALAFFAWRVTLPEMAATITPSPISTSPPTTTISTSSPEAENVIIPTVTRGSADMQSIQSTYTPWPTSTNTAP
ncbi:MAG: protein phosphatase 2C domain-containing protein [Chloroflexota bacterium]